MAAYIDFQIGSATVFTYGNLLCNPFDLEVPEHVIRHEHVYSLQQSEPRQWRNRYVEDPAFRLEQELEAYRAQCAFIKTEVRDRNKRTQILTRLAGELSGPTYGHVITAATA